MFTEIPLLIYQIGKNSKVSQYTVGKVIEKQALPHITSGNAKSFNSMQGN